jgi:hypothetical protein
VSFLIFMFLPSGKKLFIITTLLFSILLIIVRQGYFFILSLGDSFEKKFGPKAEESESVSNSETPHDASKTTTSAPNAS